MWRSFEGHQSILKINGGRWFLKMTSTTEEISSVEMCIKWLDQPRIFFLKCALNDLINWGNFLGLKYALSDLINRGIFLGLKCALSSLVICAAKCPSIEEISSVFPATVEISSLVIYAASCPSTEEISSVFPATVEISSLVIYAASCPQSSRKFPQCSQQLWKFPHWLYMQLAAPALRKFPQCSQETGNFLTYNMCHILAFHGDNGQHVFLYRGNFLSGDNEEISLIEEISLFEEISSVTTSNFSTFFSSIEEISSEKP